jgi:GNAT superfamily N-acetyltransferase
MVLTVRPLDGTEIELVCDVLPLHRLHQGDGSYLIAWDGATPVGHLHLARSSPPEVQDLTVLDSHRRRGVATTLLNAAEDACRDLGANRVAVTVSVDNAVARSLYERLGYRDTGEPLRRVTGTVELRTGPLAVDDTLQTLAKHLDQEG